MTTKKKKQNYGFDHDGTGDSGVGSIGISTDGDLAIGIGSGLTIDSGGHLGISLGGISIPFGD